jgi:LPXTG-motif cell wall-anchored protein
MTPWLFGAALAAMAAIGGLFLRRRSAAEQA